MRIKTLILVGMIAALPALGQGTLNFSTAPFVLGGSPQQVFDVGGTTPLAGNAFLGQLYAGANASSLVAIGAPQPFLTGAGAGYIHPTPPGNQVAVPGFVPGTTAMVQLRAWEASGGSTYEAALAAGVRTGTGNVFSVGPLGGNDPGGGPPFTDPNLTGFQSFALVPEPSTIALGLLGAAALLLRRRK